MIKNHAEKGLVKKDHVNGLVINLHVMKNILAKKDGEKNLAKDLHAHGEWEWEDHLVDLLDSEDLILDLDLISDLDHTLDLDLILDLDLGEGHHVKDSDLVDLGENHHAVVRNVRKNAKKNVKRKRMKRRKKTRKNKKKI